MIVERNFNREHMAMMANSILITNFQHSFDNATMNKKQVNGAVAAVEQWTHTKVYIHFYSKLRTRFRFCFQSIIVTQRD
jgi:hypothetical protein